MRKIKLAIFGCGYHARRIYLPFIKKLSDVCELVFVLDLESNREFVRNALELNDMNYIEQSYISKGDNFEINEELSVFLLDKLNNLEVDSVIISTEPTSHYEYLKFSIENNFNVLVDKPLTLKKNIVSNSLDRFPLLKDYNSLLALYKQSDNFVSCMAQRRYHPAIEKIKEELTLYYKKVNVLPSSVYIQHADGQFRSASEVEKLNYHGFNEGYGKCGHSGYHFFDLAYLYASCFGTSTDFNKVISSSTFNYADNYCKYLSSLNIDKSFKEPNIKLSGYGEVDALVSFNLENVSEFNCSIVLSLLHNSLTSRSWINSKLDLYKGNGRLRHETHIINVGPFATIYYMSYQGDHFMEEDYDGKFGKEGHSELHIFRNSELLGVDIGDYENIKFNDLRVNGVGEYSRGHQEFSRWLCFKEFIDKHNDDSIVLKSDLESHFYSVLFLDLAYASQNQLVEYNLNNYV